MNPYNLNDEQWKAVSIEVPVYLNASAGSGKTSCITAKTRLLVDKGANPISILSVTFTNKAADEMKKRLKEHININDMQISTFHSMCIKIIKKFIHHTPLNTPFSIYDDSDQISIIKTIVKSRGISIDPNEALSKIGDVKSGKLETIPENIKEIYESYQNILFKNNACDFDDLLIYAELCLRQKDCKEYFSNLWQHILVDEFQDTNTIQFKIIKHLYNPNKTKTLFLVGDKNQSVYSWRGANPENIDDFIKNYDPKVCYLTYNYRSCPEIINQANKFLQFGKPMVSKNNNTGKVSFSQFSSQEDEALKIAEALQKVGDYENTAILFRVNTRSFFFEKAFAQKRIPYKIVGALPFYKRKVAKDLLSYCKAALNRSDLESLVRIVNIPKRGFGDKKQEQLLLKGWPYLQECSKEIPLIDSLINLLNRIRSMKPVDAIDTIIQNTGYKNLLTKDTDHIMLDSFIDIISGFNTIEDLILSSNFIEEDTGYGVKLMSAHASKGLEFNRVFVVGLEEGVWPHKYSENILEEHRLYYVAISRAKKSLNISYSRSKLFKGQPMHVDPSYLFTDSLPKSQ